ncbi:MAG: hypothetical protein WA883_09170 [Phormidesmis sp.]
MQITYVNRKQQTYYLHQGKTKTGKPRYFFSQKSESALPESALSERAIVEEIPNGYEIYENPNSQVFLRKILVKIITDSEISCVEKGLKQFSSLKDFLIDVKKQTISVFTPNQNLEALEALMSSSKHLRSPEETQAVLAKSITYSADLRFVLLNKVTRVFQTERFCYLGKIDDWIEIGAAGKLETLVKAYAPHVGQESLYELY